MIPASLNTMLMNQPVSAPSGFLPSDIASLTLWIDFDDSATLTLDGTEIDQVNSKVGSNFATPTIANLREPTIVTTDGSNWARFAADALKTNATFAPRTLFFTTNNTASASRFLDGVPASTQPLGVITGEDNTASGIDFIFIRTATDYTISIDGSTSHSGTVYTDLNISGTGLNINLGLTEPQKAGKRIWCVTSATPFTNLSLIGKVQLGTSEYVANGDIGDLICYTDALTVSQINQVGNYLALKRAMTWSDF